MSLFIVLPQDLLADIKTAQDSLIVLQELGEELKSRVEASAAAAIQSDQLSLNQNLLALEQALCKQQTVLQVCREGFQFLHLFILLILKIPRLPKATWEKKVMLPVHLHFPDFPGSQSRK